MKLSPADRLLGVREGAFGSVAVVQHEGHRRIKLNNYYVLGGTAAAGDERLQGHIPLLLHPRPEHVAYLGLGTGIYLSAGLGSGPRDSLMVALSARRGWTTGRARVVIELGVLGLGLLLGGRAGVGTLVYALSIGPVTQWNMSLFEEQRT